jgi:hypothetical protein
MAAWMSVFLLGGCISLLYWWGIDKELSTLAAQKRTEEQSAKEQPPAKPDITEPTSHVKPEKPTPPRTKGATHVTKPPTLGSSPEAQRAQPDAIPSILSPPFQEASPDEVTVICGGVNTWTREFLENKQNMAMPFALDGAIPIRVYIEDGVFYVDVHLYGGPNKPVIEITKYKFKVQNPAWDANSTANAFEVVVDGKVPVLQMIKRSASTIEINAVIPYNNGIVLAVGHTIKLLPPPSENELPIPMTPMFKYPSWKYPGQYAGQ